MKKLNKKKKGTQRAKITPGSYSFVIGNGTSRKDCDLTRIKDYGYVLACNWFFRKEFNPDILVCSDEPISKTIQKVHPQYSRNRHFYSWYAKPGSGVKKPTCPEKFSAGGLATYIAADVVQSKSVFLIGMDFFGFGSTDKFENGKINNMYVGEKHYLKDERNVAPTYRNWQRRFEWIMRNFPDVQFYHVNPFEGKSPERLRGLPNFHQVTWENLVDHVENDVELNDILVKTEEDIALTLTPNEDDIRASIERQLAGQNNSVYPDPLPPEQVLQIRKDAAKFYQQNGNRRGYPTINIGGFEVMLPFNGVREGNIERPPTDKEVLYFHNLEYNTRYSGNEASIPFRGYPKSFKKPKQKVSNDLPPPPPPGGLMDLMPPPPPGSAESLPTGFGDLPTPPPPPPVSERV